MSNPVFKLVGLHKANGQHVILDRINLSFFPALGSASSATTRQQDNKTTLLRILAGVDREDDGQALPADELRIGYVPQEPVLQVGFGVEDLFAALAGLELSEQRTRAARICSRRYGVPPRRRHAVRSWTRGRPRCARAGHASLLEQRRDQETSLPTPSPWSASGTVTAASVSVAIDRAADGARTGGEKTRQEGRLRR